PPQPRGGRARPRHPRPLRLSHEGAQAGDGRVALGAVAAGALRLRRPRALEGMREAGRAGNLRDGGARASVLPAPRAAPRPRMAARARTGPRPGQRRMASAGARLMTSEKKVVQRYPPPAEDEPPAPSFRQALVGYGSILAALVLIGVLIGLLMRVLR